MVLSRLVVAEASVVMAAAIIKDNLNILQKSVRYLQRIIMEEKIPLLSKSLKERLHQKIFVDKENLLKVLSDEGNKRIILLGLHDKKQDVWYVGLNKINPYLAQVSSGFFSDKAKFARNDKETFLIKGDSERGPFSVSLYLSQGHIVADLFFVNSAKIIPCFVYISQKY